MQCTSLGVTSDNKRLRVQVPTANREDFVRKHERGAVTPLVSEVSMCMCLYVNF